MIPVEHQRDEVPARKTGAAWLNRRSVRVLVWVRGAGIVGAVCWVSYVAVSLGSLATYGPCGGASIQESYGSTLTAAATGGSLCLAGIPVPAGFEPASDCFLSASWCCTSRRS